MGDQLGRRRYPGPRAVAAGLTCPSPRELFRPHLGSLPEVRNSSKEHPASMSDGLAHDGMPWYRTYGTAARYDGLAHASRRAPSTNTKKQTCGSKLASEDSKLPPDVELLRAEANTRRAATAPAPPSAYEKHITLSAQALLSQFDVDQDGLLNLAEARALFRAATGLATRNRRSPASMDRATFESLCGDSAKGMSVQELCAVLDSAGGALGGPPESSRAGAAAAARIAPDPLRFLSPDLDPALAAGRVFPRKRPPRPPDKDPLPPEQDTRESCRRIRAALRAEPPRRSAVGDAVDIAQLVQAVHRGDVSKLSKLLQDGVLWTESMVRVLDTALQQVLRIDVSRFPILFVAAFAGSASVFRLLAEEMKMQGKLSEALMEETSGWTLPSVICLAERGPVPAPGLAPGASDEDPAVLLRTYLDLLGQDGVEKAGRGPLLRRCLLHEEKKDGHLESLVEPFDLLLANPDWPSLVTLLVRHGGGFPHDESIEHMKLVGTRLAKCGLLAKFLDACDEGGAIPRPGSSAFAGFFCGILDTQLAPLEALVALKTLVEHGLNPNNALISGGLWPLHAVARHNHVHLVDGLLSLGATCRARNAKGQTAMDSARDAKSTAAAAVLRRAERQRRSWEEVVAAAAAADAQPEEPAPVARGFLSPDLDAQYTLTWRTNWEEQARLKNRVTPQLQIEGEERRDQKDDKDTIELIALPTFPGKLWEVDDGVFGRVIGEQKQDKDSPPPRMWSKPPPIMWSAHSA
eukprot:gnl/TRDRNA2_/TRDRNA2_142894_c0_seq1.p1 gnl/TRDRNA2_/TRDRNA2_142894_c0~~gnl/TRDRNA2_/TRDRNA2_142894_c0_seq1.p1  ORF type:complete len:767 (+),score=130.26 gnl/TRDRNA2_/TRDRNA2_142894_c0_seq1:58-2301(+)